MLSRFRSLFSRKQSEKNTSNNTNNNFDRCKANNGFEFHVKKGSECILTENGKTITARKSVTLGGRRKKRRTVKRINKRR
jgi:hypothetical protein